MAWPTGKAGQILMMLVDTNVLSAMMRIAVEPAVERWFDAQSPKSVWTTMVTVFEIRFGLALLAPGRRRDQLHDAFDIAIDDILGGACCLSIGLRRKPRRESLPGSGKSGGWSRSATSRSPASLLLAKQPSQPATPVISKTLALFWSILGRLADLEFLLRGLIRFRVLGKRYVRLDRRRLRSTNVCKHEDHQCRNVPLTRQVERFLANP